MYVSLYYFHNIVAHVTETERLYLCMNSHMCEREATTNKKNKGRGEASKIKVKQKRKREREREE